MDQKLFEKIWTNGFLILDTCTFDYICRCEFQFAKEIMDILLFCRERILVPRQVMIEMQKYFDKKKVQKGVYEIIHDLDSELKCIYSSSMDDKNKRRKVIAKVEKKRNLLERYAFQIYAKALEKLKREYVKQSKVEFTGISSCFSLADKEVDAITKNKTVNLFINMLMENTLPTLNKMELLEIQDEAQYRKERNLPPGGGDLGKQNNANGDLIIWKEILKCIKEKGVNKYLFITNDRKRKNNWFGVDDVTLHPELEKEVYKLFHYKALSISTLYVFLTFCKPYIDKDIDALCNYLLNNNESIILQLESYITGSGSDDFFEEVNEHIRHNYMGDWVIPYDYEIEIDSMDYTVDIQNESIETTFDFLVSGNMDVAYHWGGENNIFDSEYYIQGTARISIPIQIGIYSEIMSLDYKNKELQIDNNLDISTTDPLYGDEEDETEDMDEYYYVEEYE